MTTSFKILTDSLAITISWITAYYIRFYSGIETPLGIPPSGLYFKLIPFIVLIWIGTFFITGHYSLRQPKSLGKERIKILQSSGLATLAFIAFTYFYEEYKYSRITLFIFAFLHPIIIAMSHSLLRKSLRSKWGLVARGPWKGGTRYNDPGEDD